MRNKIQEALRVLYVAFHNSTADTLCKAWYEAYYLAMEQCDRQALELALFHCLGRIPYQYITDVDDCMVSKVEKQYEIFKQYFA